MVIKKTAYLFKSFYFDNLFIFNSIPVLDKLISKLLPPYDKKGRVTPVTGISPTTTIKFNAV